MSRHNRGSDNALHMSGQARSETRTKLTARRHVEFGEDPIQMRANGTRREEEALTDLSVGQALGGEPRELHVTPFDDLHGCDGDARRRTSAPSNSRRVNPSVDSYKTDSTI